MTNAEKFLKDGADVDELIKGIEDYIDKKYKEEYEWFHSVPLFRYLRDFFNIDLNKPIKPTLTEDERVILKNLNDKFNKIGRTDGVIQIRRTIGELTDWHCFCAYSHLFQFIKNGEEYSIEELLK